MASLLSRLSAVSVLLGLFACGSPRSAERSSSEGEGLKVVTTFLPITLFTEAVAGECADVTALIPPSLGPHDFQASPSDLAALGQASVLVQNGVGIEEFLDDLVSSAENEDLVVIDSSRGVATIKAVGGGHDDHSDDDHSDEQSTDNHHEDDHHDDHESPAKAGDNEGHGHNHGEFDLYLADPVRAVQQVKHQRWSDRS